ncbi:hypothetical protein [Streptomyces sp. NPDC094149]|uniref:hypothetical protein n=1 Tax=Streptomyces sp. NPDC094149 TaxID=3155079 RepID=UPI00331E8845
MRRKIITLAAAALVVVGMTAPAHADATVGDGRVHLVVEGDGMSVTRVSGWMDGHGTRVQARLYKVYNHQASDVVGWRNATWRSYGGREFFGVSWNWEQRPHHYANGTWLCIQFNRADGAPCAKIKR